ncbi:uncharacterized protein LOC135420517 isoform X3 [Pseudopipra pipra]|uniref:uncharacterized protein LOC135420517 isoform X3 n=1 Tax=Pseudopipra pipra TaxID=415032 RepID=UPI0031388228
MSNGTACHSGPPRGKSQRPGEKKTQMDQGAVHKLMFPEGSSGSVPGSAEGREAMPGTGTRAKPGGDGDQEPGVGPRVEPPEGRVGPPRGKSTRPGDKKTLESNEVLKEILKELQNGRSLAPTLGRGSRVS